VAFLSILLNAGRFRVGVGSYGEGKH
jgi:hypothetical protein